MVEQRSQERTASVVHARPASINAQSAGFSRCGRGIASGRKIPTITTLPDQSDVTCKRCKQLGKIGGGL